MVITKENVIDVLREETLEMEKAGKSAINAVRSFGTDFERYLVQHTYWREFIASKLNGEMTIKMLRDPALKISPIVMMGGSTCRIGVYKRIEEEVQTNIARSIGIERPRGWWLSDEFPMEDLTRIDAVGLLFRPEAIKEELKDLKLSRKNINNRIKSLEIELKNLTV